MTDKFRLDEWADALDMHPVTVCFALGRRWTTSINPILHGAAEIAEAFDADEAEIQKLMESGARLMTLRSIGERHGFDYVRMLLWRRFDPGVLPEPFIKKSRKLLRFHPADVRTALPRMRARDRQADEHHLSKHNRVLEAA